MSDTHTTTFTAGTVTFTLGRMKAIKAARVLGELRALSKEAPQISDRIASFTRDYEEKNAEHLTQLQARVRYPSRPLWQAGEPVRDGNGDLVYGKSPVDSIPDDVWEDGGTLKLPVSPSDFEVGLATLDVAVEVAERRVYRLVALFTLSNEEVSSAWAEGEGAFDEAIETRVALLLDELWLDELAEVAITAYEQFEAQLRERPELGRRLGKIVKGSPWMKRLFPFLSSDPTTTPEDSLPTGSTPSPAGTGGTPEPSSTSPSTSYSTSDSDLTETTESDETPSTEPEAATTRSTSPPATTPAKA